MLNAVALVALVTVVLWAGRRCWRRRKTAKAFQQLFTARPPTSLEVASTIELMSRHNRPFEFGSHTYNLMSKPDGKS